MVRIKFRGRKWELKPGLKVREAIKKVGLSPSAVLAVKGGKLLTEDVVLKEGDEIELISVISGG